MMLLNKYIASSGICSRRKAVEYIKDGLVQINDETVNQPFHKVLASDTVLIEGKVVTPQKFKYFLLNKPKSVICTLFDPQNRKTIADLFSHIDERIYPVGRLDRNTTGVIVITNDGDLAQKLAHPRYAVKKIYDVTLDKSISPYHFNQLKKGLRLEDGFMKVDNVYYNNPRHKNSCSVVIHSGKNHIVKRLFTEIGFKVIKLDRSFFGGLTKKNLPSGTYRKLTTAEVDLLKKV